MEKDKLRKLGQCLLIDFVKIMKDVDLQTMTLRDLFDFVDNWLFHNRDRYGFKKEDVVE
jgi:hypothetical protein